MHWEPFHRSVNIFDFVISSFVKCSQPGTLKRGGVKRVAPYISFLATGLLFFYIGDQELISKYGHCKLWIVFVMFPSLNDNYTSMI